MIMSEVRFNVIKKEGWPSGPWDDEPDRLQWLTEAGFEGLILRSFNGSLNGYVAVSRKHPYWEKCDGDVDLDCHGGITYCGPGGFAITKLVDPDGFHFWWFGFDCAHMGDYTPLLILSGLAGIGGIYKDFYYVRPEVERL